MKHRSPLHALSTRSAISFLIGCFAFTSPAQAEIVPPTSGKVIFACDFEQKEWDPDYRGWPKNWARRKPDINYPAYIPIEIVTGNNGTGAACLEMRMDGGGAIAYSPPIPVNRYHDYEAGAKVNMKGLVHDEVFLSLTFLGEDGRPVEMYYGARLRRTNGWQDIHLGPVKPKDKRAVTAKIGLHVQPTDREDLDGSARWDDVWLVSQPHVALTASKHFPIYTDPGQVEVRCEASGYGRTASDVQFRLEDAVGTLIAESRKRIEAQRGADNRVALRQEFMQAYEGVAEWTPPISGPGYYRVFAKIRDHDGAEYESELNLAVIEPMTTGMDSIFGWSLPRRGKPLTHAELAFVLSQSGVRYVKYPLWFDSKAPTEAKTIVRFCERLGIYGIQIVGLLTDPPSSIRERIPHTNMSAAEIFGAPPDVWGPSLDPVFMQLGAQVHWWQLGQDDDLSFVGFPNLSERVALVKSRLDKVGFDVNIGFAWDWMYPYPRPSDSISSYRFLTLSMTPPMTSEEMKTYIGASPKTAARQWVVLQPIARKKYDYRCRVFDMVRRMMEAQIQQADAVFVPEAVSTDHGLINEDGSPGELLLPWRTTALHIAGGEYAGKIQMPHGSENLVFHRGKDTVVAVWNEKPVEELIYMGASARQVDLWGRSTTPRKDGSRQVFPVGPYPTFIVDVDTDLIRWRQGTKLVADSIPSILGREHPLGFVFTNDSKYGVSCRFRLVGPESFKFSPVDGGSVLGEGESRKFPFAIGLPYDATSGDHSIEIQMQVQTEQGVKEFSAFRTLSVGAGDIAIDATTRLNADGELEVRQIFTNESDDSVSFTCRLIIPGRRAMQSQVVSLGRGQREHIYKIPNGEELIGETLWIRAQEMNGVRTRQRNFVATR